MTTISIGKLRDRITIQQSTVTRGAFGGVKDGLTWAAFVSDIAADVAPLDGREFFDSRSFHSELTHRVTIRYKSGIAQDMRVLYGTRILEIRNVINVQNANRKLELMCEERPVPAT